MTDVVATLQLGDTLGAARRQIEAGGIHHLPVVDADERVIGLITYHRILETWISHSLKTHGDLADPVSDIPVDMLMEKDVLTVDVDAPAVEAARLLEKHRFGSLPVTQDEKLVGIVTARDFLHFALRYLEAETR